MLILNLPTKFPRRVTTGPLRPTPNGTRGMRGTGYNYSQTSGQASYAMYAARQRIKNQDLTTVN